MDNDLLETLVYLAILGILPYAAVEAYELAQRAIARRRQASRH
jgi:type II secretory pathway pseudopilin PulG